MALAISEVANSNLLGLAQLRASIRHINTDGTLDHLILHLINFSLAF